MGLFIHLVRILFRLIFWMISGVARLIVRALIFVLPLIFRGLWFAVELIALSIVSLIMGVPKSVERLSGDWTKKALLHGFPVHHTTALEEVSHIAAFCLFLSGWILIMSSAFAAVYWVINVAPR